MSEVNVQQTLPEIFEGLPTNENEWPEEIREDLKTMAVAMKEENGLIPTGACPELFGVSRQRWHQMCKEYMFKSWTLFGKKFYSRRQLEEFSKLDRSEYGGTGKGVNMVKMAKDALSEASKG